MIAKNHTHSLTHSLTHTHARTDQQQKILAPSNKTQKKKKKKHWSHTQNRVKTRVPSSRFLRSSSRWACLLAFFCSFKPFRCKGRSSRAQTTRKKNKNKGQQTNESTRSSGNNLHNPQPAERAKQHHRLRRPTYQFGNFGRIHSYAPRTPKVRRTTTTSSTTNTTTTTNNKNSNNSNKSAGRSVQAAHTHTAFKERFRSLTQKKKNPGARTKNSKNKNWTVNKTKQPKLPDRRSQTDLPLVE